MSQFFPVVTRRFLAGAAAAIGAGALFARGGAFAQTSEDGVFGEWNGVLAVGAARLRLRLVIEDGAATLFSLDQGGAAIPSSEAQITGSSVVLRFAVIDAAYEGRLEGGALVGTFTQGMALPLRFERGPAAAPAPPPPVTPLTPERLSALWAESQAPALAAAARGPDGRSLDLAQGLRRRDREEPVTTGDLWHVGSITKSMTATLAARYVEAGRLSWETPLRTLLPDTAMRPEYEAVTLRHLLSHRSGLAGNLELRRLAQFPREEADPRESRRAYAAEALGQAPVGPAADTFEYSNSGYVVAGVVLEALGGAPWETLIRRDLFEPLGLLSAGFGAPGTPGAQDQPAGHARGLFGLQAHPAGAAITDNPAVLGPAGRAHLSLADLLRYAGAHRDRAESFLRPESWAMLHAPPFGGDYALGLVARPDGALWHNGSNTLWYAEMLIDPHRGVVAAAAANSGELATVAPAVGAALRGAALSVSA